jgi:hypothetical protein
LALELDSGINRRSDALELCQNGIPRFMELPATMCCDYFGEQVEASIKLSMGVLLIESGETAITGNISIEDCGKSAFHFVPPRLHHPVRTLSPTKFTTHGA